MSMTPTEGIAVLSVGLGVGAAISQIFGGFSRGRNGHSPVTKEFCGVKHDELDHRFERLEGTMGDGFSRVDRTLERIFDRMESINEGNQAKEKARK